MGLDADSWARVLYLALLLAFVGGFLLLGQRHRLGRSLRDLAVWALIFAMVVIAYGFRGVLREELLPAAMVSRPDGSIELRRASDGHFHAEALVNGVPVRFLVDTGASELVLSRRGRGARRHRSRRSSPSSAAPAPRTARWRRRRCGSGASSSAASRDRGVPASVGGGALDVSLLGMSYLDRFAAIEIAGDRMTLRR